MTDVQLKKKQAILEKAKPWEKTDRWQGKQARESVTKEAADKVVDEIVSDDKSIPKETAKAPKSDTKPQANASGKPEKKDDKGDHAPKS
ncbi:hypothetical protein NY78_4263 [Desulfovibrio sp. TomC]|nr:hypothetical protein NY78_4263 [Desulfovibrio sp. TomC]